METTSRDRDRGVLLSLKRHFDKPEAKPLTADAVAERMGRDLSEVVVSLRELESQEYLLVEGNDPGVERLVVGLTPEGLKHASNW